MTSAPWSDLGGGLNKANLGTIWGGACSGLGALKTPIGGSQIGGVAEERPEVGVHNILLFRRRLHALF